MTKFRCGRVVLIGEPNVGKSSIVNKIVGEKVSIVADLPGTTRSAIRGVKTGVDYQIVFLDTPGMHKTHNQLHKFMSKSISHALAEANLVMYVLDATDMRAEFIDKIKNYEKKEIPIIIAVNKADLTTFAKLYPKLEPLNSMSFVADIIPISAKTGFNIDVLEKTLVKHLPEGEALFEDEAFTDQNTKSMAEEIIRGELLKLLHREIPHGIAVKITKWVEDRRELEIHAEIICDKPSHKPIIIGKKGAVLKTAGTVAREEIRKLTGMHVRLFTRVFVREEWRNKNSKLAEFGYVHQ